MNGVLVALLGVPLAGAVLLLLPIRAGAVTERRSLKAYGLAVSGVTLGLSLVLAAGFGYDEAARVRFSTDLAWVPGLDLRFHLGVDGISLPLIVLTTMLTFLCFVYLGRGRADGPGCPPRPEPGGGRPRALVFTLLVLEVGMIGTFLALDLLLFFVFFEIVLIPMYFVIALWGGPGRRAAAVKFILYTLLGSIVLLLGLLFIWAQTGTLDMIALARAQGAGMSRSAQVTAFVAVGLGLAVKAPMWPLHTWLPAAHTEAPTVGSVLLAGVLLKMGTYGFARIAVPVLPGGAAAVAPWLGAFAVIGIVYGSLACLAQRDLKRMIAYSSIGHMGFVLLGFATLTPVGMNAALFGNVAHGLITALLFFVVGGIKERYGTTAIPALGGGMLSRLPHLGSLFTFACVASLGLPGLAGFWGEMLALLGAYDPAEGLSRPLYVGFMVVGGLGTLLTAAYFLIMLSRVTHGRPVETLHVPLLTAKGVSPKPPRHEAAPPTSPGDVPVASEGAPVSPGGAPVLPGGAPAPFEGVPVSSEGAPATSGGVPAAEGSGGRAAAVVSAGGAGSRRMPDVTGYELAAWVPLVVLILLFGLWPNALLLLTDPVVQTLLGAP